MQKTLPTDSNAGKFHGKGNVYKVTKNWTINDLPVKPMTSNIGADSP